MFTSGRYRAPASKGSLKPSPQKPEGVQGIMISPRKPAPLTGLPPASSNSLLLPLLQPKRASETPAISQIEGPLPSPTETHALKPKRTRRTESERLKQEWLALPYYSRLGRAPKLHEYGRAPPMHNTTVRRSQCLAQRLLITAG
jgi:hypothetical protein